MVDVNPTNMLSPDQLNEHDDWILDYLSTDGRATPALIQDEYNDREGDAPSRQYINRRLTRLAEHGHVRNVKGHAVYELVEDPRESN